MDSMSHDTYKIFLCDDGIVDTAGPYWYWSGPDICGVLTRIAAHYHRDACNFAAYDHVTYRYTTLRNGALVDLGPVTGRDNLNNGNPNDGTY